MRILCLLCLVLFLAGCCTCPKTAIVIPNPYSQENLRRGAKEMELIELQKQQMELQQQQINKQKFRLEEEYPVGKDN